MCLWFPILTRLCQDPEIPTHPQIPSPAANHCRFGTQDRTGFAFRSVAPRTDQGPGEGFARPCGLFLPTRPPGSFAAPAMAQKPKVDPHVGRLGYLQALVNEFQETESQGERCGVGARDRAGLR